MISALEVLSATTVLLVLGAGVQALRREGVAAQRLLVAGLTAAVAAAFMYWFLDPG